MKRKTMFDPFKDFKTNGYLRNVLKHKDAADVTLFEHNVFRANLSQALDFLSEKRIITYQDFLTVHRILFSDYYPWAGEDRRMTLPDLAVRKQGVLFSHPQECQRAVEHGLGLGANKKYMSDRPGEIMGLFAFGHPFLDGNGRTILLVHMELAYRARFSIAWANTNKNYSLTALTEEINTPSNRSLDSYLLQFKTSRQERDKWGSEILALKGLDGLDADNQIDGNVSDPTVMAKYAEIHAHRGYSYESQDILICQNCDSYPCVCEKGGGGSAFSKPGKP